MRAILAAAALVFALPCVAKVPDEKRVEALALRSMAETGAKGLAVAVIDDGQIASVQAFGVRNARGEPLTIDTIMYGASLTKAAFAYAVMQIAEEGKLDLDRPVAEYLAEPLPAYGNLDAYGNWGDLEGDERWRQITPRILLTHSAGFANFAFLEPDGKLKMHFDPGTRYAYSGEGVMLLQFTLEQGLGLKVGEEMQRRVFDRFGMVSTSMTWKPQFARNLADGWNADGKVEPHDERSRVRAAGSMDTSIADFARFAAGFMRGEGLGTASREQMIRPHLPITSRSQFPTLLPEPKLADRWPNLASGLGVVSFAGPQGRGFFKGGHNDSTANMWTCLEQGRRCVLLLSNDVRSEAAFPALVDAILGETGLPWRWEYSAH